MFKTILVLVAAFSAFQNNAQAKVGAADQWFSGHFQNQKLSCYEGQTHSIFVLWANSQGIQGKAIGGNRKFQVDHSSISALQLKVTMNNDIDGPLSSDVLIFELNALNQLGAHQLPETSAIDYYSEGFDGTSQHYHMTCHLVD